MNQETYGILGRAKLENRTIELFMDRASEAKRKTAHTLDRRRAGISAL
jgi:hypothetical protein